MTNSFNQNSVKRNESDGVTGQVVAEEGLRAFSKSHPADFWGGTDMRTTLVIPDAAYRRAKKAAKEQGRTLSELFAESVEIQLAPEQQPARSRRNTEVFTPVPNSFTYTATLLSSTRDSLMKTRATTAWQRTALRQR